MKVLGHAKSGDLTLVEAAELLEVSYRKCKRGVEVCTEGESGQVGEISPAGTQARAAALQDLPNAGQRHLGKEDGLGCSCSS
jgi:hypothetical protein